MTTMVEIIKALAVIGFIALCMVTVGIIDNYFNDRK